MEKSKEIFGNPVPEKIYKKACKNKAKFQKKFGNEDETIYHLKATPNETLKDLGVMELTLADDDKPLKLADNAVVVGNIRMGFGHYRISIAMASAAKALGYTPYWIAYNNLPTTGGKVIEYQNKLYSMGSRLSQKSRLFNKLYWEPLNSEGFRQYTYNAGDQKNAELVVPVIRDLPKDVPYIATHVWPSQGAIHNGMTHVVNAIPDNWPMALHLSEGAIHTVQTPFAFLGYKKLNGMNKKKDLLPMPDGVLYDVGHYIDHELVVNLEEDTAKRVARLEKGKPLRFLMTVGGAGAQYNLFKQIIEFLIPYIKEGKVNLFINFGDHLNVYEKLKKSIKEYSSLNKEYFNAWNDLNKMIKGLKDDSPCGINSIYHEDIFKAVYSTNLLMRHCDLLITKPSELAYYPIPKLMIQRVGGHEAYGAIHASEIGDGTWECQTIKEIGSMIKLMLTSTEVLKELNSNIIKQLHLGTYNGAYEVVKLAIGKK